MKKFFIMFIFLISCDAILDNIAGDSPPVNSEHIFKFEIMTDKFPSDNSWKLFNEQDIIVAEGPDVPYEPEQLHSATVPVPNGNYRLEVYDSGGDGLRSGFVQCYMDNMSFFWGRYWFDDPGIPYKKLAFSNKGVVKFRVGPGSYILTEREQGYLNEHNRHRKIAHEAEGLKYVPLRWNSELADYARAWAEHLTEDNCKLVHEQNTGMGENLAARMGTAAPRPIEGVVQSWVNSEGHYYQLKWRGSHYMGCGEAYGEKCSVQACRFIAPGNCNGYDNWIEDYTLCGVVCPPGGCYTEN